MAPLSLDSRKRPVVAASTAITQLDEESEYRFVRRDLWRLAGYSVLCFVLMIAVLLVVD
jgi:hypothetical protein